MICIDVGHESQCVWPNLVEDDLPVLLRDMLQILLDESERQVIFRN